MKREQARAIHTNDVCDDEEMASITAIVDAAAPGEWRVRDGKVCRFNGEPVTDDASLAFMCKARGIVPRLVKHAAAVECALQVSRAETLGARAELCRRTEQMTEALDRANQHQPGRDYGLRYIAEAAVLGMLTEANVKAYILRWLRGEDEAIAADLRWGIYAAHAEQNWNRRQEDLRKAGAAAFQRYGEKSPQFAEAEAAYKAHCATRPARNDVVDPTEREVAVEPDEKLAGPAMAQLELWRVAS